MKKTLIIILILFIMLTPSSNTPGVVDVSAEDLDAYGIAGAMMMVEPVIVDPDDVPMPKPDIAKDCKCKNGKVSYDGGTSFSDCPCITSGGKCLCPKTMSEDAKTDLIPRTVLITQPYFEGRPNCPPCIRVDNEIVAKLKDSTHKARGWDVGDKPSDDFQILDLNDPAAVEEIKRLGLEYSAVPTFFLLSGDKTKEHEGYMSYNDYMKWVKKTPLYSAKSTTKWSLNKSFTPSREELLKALKSEASVKRNLEIFSDEELMNIYNDVRNGVYSE